MDEFRIFTGLNAYTYLYMMIDHLLTYIKQFIKGRVRILWGTLTGTIDWPGLAQNFKILLTAILKNLNFIFEKKATFEVKK